LVSSFFPDCDIYPGIFGTGMNVLLSRKAEIARGTHHDYAKILC